MWSTFSDSSTFQCAELGHGRCKPALLCWSWKAGAFSRTLDLLFQGDGLMKRREFCAHACQAMSLVAVGSVLQGCGGSSTSPSNAGGGSSLPTINAAVSNRTIAVTVDAASPLASVGGTALVQTTSGNFLVARISQEAFSALTAVCTHEGCTVSNVSGTTFICPCHGSQFSTSGSVVKSPASRPLTSFATQFAGNTLTITI
jgi:cytochrome b6-f complex iron-sulfur subunit